MKCNVCGKELSDKAKFCTSCGSPVENPASGRKGESENNNMEQKKVCPMCGHELADYVRFCTKCGYNFTAPVPEEKEEPLSYDNQKEKGYEIDSDRDEVEGKTKKTNKMVIAVVIVLCTALVAIVGVLLFKGFFGDKTSPKKDDMDNVAVENQTSDENNTKEESISISIASKDKETEETEESTTDDTTNISVAAEKEQGETNGGLDLKYCDNTYCNINNNLTKDDFQYIECPDDNYHFYYPKNLYNHWSYSAEDGFYFWYDDNGTTITSLHVYSEDCSGDLFENAKNLSQSMKNSVKKVSYSFPDNIKKHGVGEDGIMQVVVSGWTDSAHTDAKYMVGGNDGTKNYIMEVTYPDYDEKNDLEDWDYIVNTLYRYCSFSGSTKAPFPNYNAFLDAN